MITACTKAGAIEPVGGAYKLERDFQCTADGTECCSADDGTECCSADVGSE